MPDDMPVEIFPLTTSEDTHDEAALKMAAALRQFGVTDLADELEEACAKQGEPDLIDIMDEALTAVGESCPPSLELRYFEEGESGHLRAANSSFDGYAFVSRKESLERWREAWPDDLCNEALRLVDEAQRKRHDPNA
jgi:hypothetical protein